MKNYIINDQLWQTEKVLFSNMTIHSYTLQTKLKKKNKIIRMGGSSTSSILTGISTSRFLFVPITRTFYKRQNIKKQRGSWKQSCRLFSEKNISLNITQKSYIPVGLQSLKVIVNTFLIKTIQINHLCLFLYIFW